MDSTAEARIEAARHLRARGLTYRKIGAAIGVSHVTARKYAPGPRGDCVGEGETPPPARAPSENAPVPSEGLPSGPPVGEGVTPPPALAPASTVAGPMRGGMSDRTPGPEARKLATQCVRMARFIEDQRATLAAKVAELADATGWDVEAARTWVERKAER